MKPLLIILLLVSIQTNAQQNLGIGTKTPDSSAAVDIKSTTQGLLIPRMNHTQRATISKPAQGLMVYQTDSDTGFYFYKGAAWANISKGSSGSSNYVGKTILIITDTISNAAAQAQIAAEFGPQTQEIRIIGCSKLTSIDLSVISTIAGITILNNPVLQTVNLSNMTLCDGDFTINKCFLLSDLNLSSLQTIIASTDNKGTDIENTALINLQFPALKKINGPFYINRNQTLLVVNFPVLQIACINQYSFGFFGNNVLESIKAPLLTNCGQFSIQSSNHLAIVSFPILTAVGSLNFGYNDSIQSVSFPSLTSINDSSLYVQSSINSNPFLTNISLGILTNFKNTSFNFSGNKLPSSQVNYLLGKLVSITPALTGKSFSLTQNPSAPPTGQGISDKATLIANGNTVSTN